MQKEYLKFGLISALMAGFVNFIIDQTNLFRGFFMDFMILGICVFAGIFVGLWIIGRIRKPSFSLGILVFILCYVAIAFFWLVGAVLYLGAEGRLSMLSISLQTYSQYLALPYAVIGFTEVLIGIAIIRRGSPSFCSNCGKNLPAGRSDCKECGKRQEVEISAKWAILGVLASLIAALLIILFFAAIPGYPIGF
jgi:hypothetical protein